MEDLTGKEFGPYRILAPLGEGGMATVYKAYHPAMEREVAIKVLPRQYAEDPTFVKRFKQEAVLLAKLQHPHILPVFDFGEADGYTYLVMPLVLGGSLSELMAAGPLPLDRAVKAVAQIGEALDYAHSRGLVHRDVKPGNVLLDERGNCMLSDFGIAKILEGHEKITRTGGIIGTPDYMSPEQGSGDPVDARSDIYALGVMLYEMVTGRAPYIADTPVAVIIKHMQDPLPLPRKLRPDLPQAIENVILRAMAKIPEDRFQTAHDMVAALQAAAGPGAAGAETAAGPGAARPASPPRPPAAAAKASRRGLPAWAWLGGGGCLVVLLVALCLGARTVYVAVTRANTVPTQIILAMGVTEAPLMETSAPAMAAPVMPTQATAVELPTQTPAPTLTPPPTPIHSTTRVMPTSDTVILPNNLERLANVAVITRGSSALTWSPDGQTLAVGSTLYAAPDFTQGSEIRSCYKIAYSSDFKMMACSASEGVQLVYVDGGGDIASLANTDGGGQMAFSPDGRLLAINFDGVIRLYDTTTGIELRNMLGGSGIDSPLAFSPDGTLLATTTGVSEIKLLDVVSGDEKAILKGHENWINCLTFSPDGSMLASGSVDQTVRLWDVASGKMLRKLSGQTGQIDGVAFSPDGWLLASVSWDLTIKLWRTDTWKEAGTLTGHAAWMQEVAFSPDGTRLATSSIDSEVRVWALSPP